MQTAKNKMGAGITFVILLVLGSANIMPGFSREGSLRGVSFVAATATNPLLRRTNYLKRPTFVERLKTRKV